MFFKFVLSLTICVFLICKSTNGMKKKMRDELVCDYAPGLTVGNRTQELECCNATEKIQLSRWATGSRYLSTYLEKLQAWKCPQFRNECKRQIFNYNDFTNLMYMRFCNKAKLEQLCFSELKNAVNKQSNHENLKLSTWNEALKFLNVLKLNDQDILLPCLQIAMYDADSRGVGYYHEVIEPVVPFCSFTWCGFDQEIVKTRRISSWTCMPKSCQANVIVVMVINAILAFATFMCNTTIIAVLFQKKFLQNGQAIYRLSLAFADLLVGAIVFPTFITTLQKYILLPHELGELRNVTGYNVVNGTADLSHLSTVEVTGPSGLFRTRFSRTYLNTVGFFTVLSLFVSVNTLVAACIDRFIAVYRPLRYDTLSAVNGARFAVILIWVLGLLFSTIPLYVRNMRYGVVAAVLISSAGTKVLILYAVAFIVPLLIMWVLTITTIIIAKQRSHRISTARSSDNTSSLSEFEMRLMRTLGVMVGVFTLCLLPAILVLLSGIFLSDIYFNRPLALSQNAVSSYTSAEVVAVIFLTSNSLWNCFIYSARDRSFRDATKRLYGRAAHLLRLDAMWKFVCSKLGRNRRLLVNCDSQTSTTAASNDVRDTSFFPETEFVSRE